MIITLLASLLLMVACFLMLYGGAAIAWVCTLF